MSFLKSGNPTLREKAFSGTILEGISTGDEMTIKGTMNRFIVLFLLMITTPLFSWSQFYQGGDPTPLMITGVLGGFVVGIVMAFKKQWSPFLAPAFALLEGLF